MDGSAPNEKSNMKKTIFIMVFLQIALSSAYAQWIDEGEEEWATLNFPRAWISYLHDTKADRSILRQNYFKDTISVEEMKAAFEQYKDTIFRTSPYAGYDSINTFYGKFLVLLSPLKGVPMKDVWMTQNKDKAKLLTGDIIFLKEPKRYMGYTVTPNPFLETRNKGYIKVVDNSVFSYCADFFSFISPILGGSWTRRTKGGAKLLGNLIDMGWNFDMDHEERTFSVLLYEKHKDETGKEGTYGLELLSPKALDEVHNYVGPSYADKQRSESHNGYTRDIKIYQQNFDDTESTAEYTLYNVFPKSVDAVDLNGSDTTNLLEYRVTFAYSHYTVRTLDEGTSTLVDKAMAALENGLTAAADAIMDSVNSALSEGLAAAGDALGDLISDTSGDETFEKLIDGATDFFYDPGGWMNDIATSVGSSISSAVSGVVDSAKNSIKESFK